MSSPLDAETQSLPIENILVTVLQPTL